MRIAEPLVTRADMSAYVDTPWAVDDPGPEKCARLLSLGSNSKAADNAAARDSYALDSNLGLELVPSCTVGPSRVL